MSAPTVCAVMLTRDRPELAAKAVECFRRQTYDRKRLLIWNASEAQTPIASCGDNEYQAFQHPLSLAIGGLRNAANRFESSLDASCTYEEGGPPEIFIHWDDDDWSHPNRITEQVALLQASGADVVGYSEMLFWREASLPQQQPDGMETKPRGEAWLFQCAKQLTPAVGTSLCYWRKTWERTKFADLPRGPGGQSEYREFLRNNKVVAVPSLGCPDCMCGTHNTLPHCPTCGLLYDPMRPTPVQEPRMIARIHGANFSPYNIEEQIARGSNAMPNEGWTRLPEWDAQVREILG